MKKKSYFCTLKSSRKRHVYKNVYSQMSTAFG